MRLWKKIFLFSLIPPLILYFVLIFNEAFNKKDKLIIIIINSLLWFVFWLVHDYFMYYR